MYVATCGPCIVYPPAVSCSSSGNFNSITCAVKVCDSVTCASKKVCSWSDISENDIRKGMYSVPAPGCKMKKKN